jgi:hypothetical protein
VPIGRRAPVLPTIAVKVLAGERRGIARVVSTIIDTEMTAQVRSVLSSQQHRSQISSRIKRPF